MAKTKPTPDARELSAKYPGAEAVRPQEIPRRGWMQILRRAWAEATADQVPLLAAGVAFFGFLSLFPALIAAVLVYGLVADPDDVTASVRSLGAALPDDARSLLTEQLNSLVNTSRGSLTVGLAISVLLALWSASGAIGNLISAVNVAYDENETRGFVKRKALALALTLGAICFMLVSIGLVAVVPAVADALDLAGPARVVIEIVRWVVLTVLVAGALALLYRWSPDRDSPKFRWASVGAITATLVWLLASFGFSVYVDNFGNYGKTYGSLAGVVILLLWLWISAYVVLLGAEMNAEAEEQTIQDTTRGGPRPIGDRNAVKADSVPSDPATEKSD